GLLLAHQHDRGAGVVHARRIAGGHRAAVLLEHRRQLGHGLERRVLADVLVTVEVDHVLPDLDLNGDDLVVEPAGLARRGGAPVPHRRLTVNAGVSFGRPAFIPTTRAMYMSAGSVWITLPNTTWSIWPGSRPARSMAAVAAVAPRSVGGMSFSDFPYEPIAVR